MNGSSREGANPSVHNRTRENGQHTNHHENQHNELMVFKEDTEIHDDKADENERKCERTDPVYFIFVRFQ